MKHSLQQNNLKSTKSYVLGGTEKKMTKSRNLINKKHFIFKHLYNIQLILLFADNIFAKLDNVYL